MKGLLAGIILFALLVLTIGCSDYKNTLEEEGTPTTPPSTAQSLQILSHSMSRPSRDKVVVQGIAKNGSSSLLKHADIVVKFYDKDGIYVGISTDWVTNLEAGESWRFEVPKYERYKGEVADYKFTVEESAGMPTTPPIAQSLQILSHSMSRESRGKIVVRGVAKNVGSFKLKLTTVLVRFYDKEGVRLGISTDAGINLEPGESWRFEVPYFESQEGVVARYEIGVEKAVP